MRFITDYLSIDHKLVRKPYLLPRIGEIMQKLEGLQYEAALDINMVYYTIRFFPYSKDMTTIVTEFGTFRYNHLPMGMCASGGIFQARVDKLLSDI